MLSISNVSVEMASTYYEKDNYYTKQRGAYFGSLKNELGLNDLTHDSFQDLIRGRANGVQLIQNGANGKHRAGYDCTFTSPKSLSVLLEIVEAKGNEELALKIRNAHDKAVNQALEQIENNYITYNKKEDGISNHIKTGGMIVAKFEHDTSRELDPTLHTHCVIMNMTKDENGNYKAISNEILYDNKMINGQFYRSELAKNLKELGLDIEITNSKQMLFEIKGIDNSLITEFSQRSKQIEESLEELRAKYPNASESELKQFAALESRVAKKEVDRDAVRANNLQRAESLTNTDELLTTIQKDNLSFKKLNVQEIIEKSAQIITENESTFLKEQLLKNAIGLSFGELRANELWSEIENSKLIKLDENTFTTKEILQIEKEIIEFSRATKESVKELRSEKEVKSFIEKNYSTMTKGQKEAVEHILTCKDKIVGIQGDAGTGKTFMLEAINKNLKNSDVELIGLAFTGKASDELEEGSGIKSTTLHSFLNQSKVSEKEKIYIVDEASFVGSKQMKQLIEKAQKDNARIVLIGDTKQFQAISAGAIFEQLQQRGMKTAVMEESLRQKTDALKESVKWIKHQDTDKAFSILESENSIVESQDLIQDTIKAYQQDKEALIITSLNSERVKINDAIREIKIKDGEIKLTVDFKVKEAVNLSGVEQFYAKNYQEKQLIFVNESKNGLKAGDEFSIVKVNVDSNEVIVKNKLGFKKKIDISKCGNQLSIFNIKNQNFGIGDKVIFSKNDKALKVKNGNIATIEKLDEKGNIECKLGKRIVKFNINKNYNYLDYGYCITDVKSQGATANNVIIVANSKMAKLQSFYTQVTRAKYGVKIITDNLTELKQNVVKREVKTTTLNHAQQNISKIKTLIEKLDTKHIQNLLQTIKEKYQILKEEILHANNRERVIARDMQSKQRDNHAQQTNERDTHGHSLEADATRGGAERRPAELEGDVRRRIVEALRDSSNAKHQQIENEDELER
jgi:conjugative relaxase-like TrwC/TraI family protein